MNESQLLSSIASAIGMLDASRRGTCVSYAKVESPRFLAFKSYSCSMKSLSTAILDPTVSLRGDVLWATFFWAYLRYALYSAGNPTRTN